MTLAGAYKGPVNPGDDPVLQFGQLLSHLGQQCTVLQTDKSPDQTGDQPAGRNQYLNEVLVHVPSQECAAQQTNPSTPGTAPRRPDARRATSVRFRQSRRDIARPRAATGRRSLVISYRPANRSRNLKQAPLVFEHNPNILRSWRQCWAPACKCRHRSFDWELVYSACPLRARRPYVPWWTQIDRLQNSPFERQIGDNPHVHGNQSNHIELIICILASTSLTGPPHVVQVAWCYRCTLRHSLCTTACLHLNPIQAPFVINHDVVRQSLLGEISSVSRKDQVGHHQMLGSLSELKIGDALNCHAATTPRDSATWSNVWPPDSSVATLSVNAPYLRQITSQYFGSSSITRACLPVFSQAISVEPDPANGSNTVSRVFEELRIARSINSTGFIVGCRSFFTGFFTSHTSPWSRAPHQK